MQLIHGDCLEEMKNIPDARTVKPIKLEMRYFYIKYTASGVRKVENILGSFAIKCTAHPNFMEIKKYVKKKNHEVKDLVVDFIHEFKSEDDFDDF